MTVAVGTPDHVGLDARTELSPLESLAVLPLPVSPFRAGTAELLRCQTGPDRGDVLADSLVRIADIMVGRDLLPGIRAGHCQGNKCETSDKHAHLLRSANCFDQQAGLPVAPVVVIMQGLFWAPSRASRSWRLRSAHSARVPQNLVVARRLPIGVMFSQIRSFGSPTL
jgi:hypothetical protein